MVPSSFSAVSEQSPIHFQVSWSEIVPGISEQFQSSFQWVSGQSEQFQGGFSAVSEQLGLGAFLTNSNPIQSNFRAAPEQFSKQAHCNYGAVSEQQPGIMGASSERF